jgi:hypothetical protein
MWMNQKEFVYGGTYQGRKNEEANSKAPIFKLTIGQPNYSAICGCTFKRASHIGEVKAFPDWEVRRGVSHHDAKP